MGKKIGKFTYMISTAKNKKLMVVSPSGKLLHFGDIRHEHYYDKTGLLDKKLNHKDKVRRISYLQRTAKIIRKDGSKTKDDPESSNYHSRKILW
tara:strand:+ start:574 stop:855 length:282 start_codon:yes stop_codon:yes gene_type:complete